MIPRGIRNNNPLNIRHNRNNRWQGASDVQDDPEFVRFGTIHFGVRAGFVILRNYIKGGCNTLQAIIKRWAPPSENDTNAYLHAVTQMTGLQPNHIVDFNNMDEMCNLVHAMIRMECGRFIDYQIIRKAYGMV